MQKIMHTRKRHQDMFQDLNRKLQHAAEKDKEAMAPDGKVWDGVGGSLRVPRLVPTPTPLFIISLACRVCWALEEQGQVEMMAVIQAPGLI